MVEIVRLLTKTKTNKNMGLPTSITLGSEVFDDVSKLSGTTVTYFAPSPQGDLIGRPSIRFSQEKTKAGIVRTLVSFQRPRFNEDTQKYEGFYKIDVVANRSESAPVATTESTYLNVKDLLGLAGIVSTLAKGLI